MDGLGAGMVRHSGGAQHTARAVEVERVTRLEEATGSARHAGERIAELAGAVYEIADSRLGPRPPTPSTSGAGASAMVPDVVGTVNRLECELRAIHQGLDRLSAEIHRLREL